MISFKINLKYRAFLILCMILFVLLSYVKMQARPQKKIESTDPALRLNWFKQHTDMKESSIFKGLKWRFIGPDVISGRCTDIAVPKGSRQTIYVGAATGGVWKTVNSGITWEPIMDDIPSISIGDIAIAPSNADIVWVGTGEANIFRASVAGTGVYKSIDAGKTWQHMGLAGTHTVSRIVIHPRKSDIVYVTSTGHEWTDNEDRGVFKTTDGGKTWQKVFYISERIGACDLSKDMGETGERMAGTGKRPAELFCLGSHHTSP